MRAHAIGQFSRIRPIPVERIARYLEAFLSRFARFQRLAGLLHERTASVFHKSAGVYPAACVSSLIPRGNDATSASCARVNATFCIASRRQNDKSRARTLHRNLFAVVRITTESTLRRLRGV